jgi:hypothetical protein
MMILYKQGCDSLNWALAEAASTTATMGAAKRMIIGGWVV